MLFLEVFLTSDFPVKKNYTFMQNSYVRVEFFEEGEKNWIKVADKANKRT